MEHALGKVYKVFEKGPEELRISRRIVNDEITENSPGNQRKPAVSNSNEIPLANTSVKNS